MNQGREGGPAARRAQAALPPLAAQAKLASPGRKSAGSPRRVVGLLRRAPAAGSSCHDPLIERPDLGEDDYYRFRHRPHGW